MSRSNALSAVSVEGNSLASLRALRDRLAVAIDTTDSPRDLAPLAARFTDVLAQIDLLDPPVRVTKGTALDELATRRRTTGRPDSTGGSPSARLP